MSVDGVPSNSNRLQYLRHNGPEHVLAFAPTRSGKGVGLVIPTLLAWSESAVIYDIKGENWAKTAGFRTQQGHLCFKFSPVEDNASSRFNPLSEVRLFTPRDVSDAQNIANMIVRTGEDSPQERYWQDAGASITTGMILHVCYQASLKAAWLHSQIWPMSSPHPVRTSAIPSHELLNFPHDPGYKHGWRHAHRREDRDASCGPGEGAGDARQGGEGFQRRPQHGQNGADAVTAIRSLPGIRPPAISPSPISSITAGRSRCTSSSRRPTRFACARSSG